VYAVTQLNKYEYSDTFAEVGQSTKTYLFVHTFVVRNDSCHFTGQFLRQYFSVLHDRLVKNLTRILMLIYCLLFSDGARCEVYENGGVERLAKLLTDQLMAEAEAPKTLPRIACGFLFNLINTHGWCIFFCHRTCCWLWMS